MPATKPAKWLLLIHQVPGKPDYLRVKVGRRLRQLGAVAVKNSVYVVPDIAEVRPALRELARSIRGNGGEAAICEARFIDGLGDRALADLIRAARAIEYTSLGRAAHELGAEFVRGKNPTETRRRAAARRLDRLRAQFDEVVSHDTLEAPGRERAARLLSLAEDRIQGVEWGATSPIRPAPPPLGATWVTRTGVMVDRIASAWLIRRFIDARARFKFVPSRGYRPARQEIRFDMAGAEFTHVDERCTFEVLVEHFDCRDAGLKPIAEIVHDLDLEDAKYGRAEAVGVERVLVGMAIAKRTDDVRLAQGVVLFDNLYESFRKRSR